MAELTDDEMNILATAVANLVNTRSLTKISPDMYNPDKTKYRILCSDGKRRRTTRKKILQLLEKITNLAGHELSDDAWSIIRGAV